MTYQLEFSGRADKDYRFIVKNFPKSTIKKLINILSELTTNPRTGSGKPERLKHYDGEVWSRKIDKKNRIYYSINDDEVIVIVISIKGHYRDK